MAVSEAALSCCISRDKIFSREQFFYNEDTDFLDEGGFAQVYKARLRDGRGRGRRHVNGGTVTPVVAAKVLVGGKNKKSRLGDR